MRALLFAVLVAGCTSDKYLVVTVDAPPAVQGATALVVTLSNGGTSRMDTLPLSGHAFPVTFSVSAPGRAGDLDIKVEAQSLDMLDVGVGSGAAKIGDSEATVMLDTTDFVVNTDYAMDQFLAQDYEANGLQLAATSDGHWAAAFRDSCSAGPCTIFGRTFDPNGVPLSTAAAASTHAFAFSSMSTSQASMPALAASDHSVLAFWDAYDPTTATIHGVACRSLDAAGNLSAGEVNVAVDEADVVTATQLSNHNIAVTWQVYSPNSAIHGVIVTPSCTPLGNVFGVSTTVGTTGPHRSHVASNGTAVLYAWIQDGDVHVRLGSNIGLTGNDTTLIMHTATSEAEAVRVAPMGTGFALVARSADPAGTGAGKIELFQVSTTGTLVGTAQLVTDQSLSDFSSGEQSFGLGTNGQGLTLVAWHVCDSNGTTCDVFGRVAKADGTMTGPAFMLPTTTDGDQKDPSVVGLPTGFAVAWDDTSHLAPDTQGSAVRARIFYPPM
jgi:hypothetical protein